MSRDLSPELLAYPMESHAFEGGGNQYLCQVCRRPRAMHYRYPFIGRKDPEHFLKGFPVRYRGPHPRFSRPGTPNPEPLAVISPAKVAVANQIRDAARRRLERAVGQVVLSAQIQSHSE